MSTYWPDKKMDGRMEGTGGSTDKSTDGSKDGSTDLQDLLQNNKTELLIFSVVVGYEVMGLV